jgi:hypothetical protein
MWEIQFNEGNAVIHVGNQNPNYEYVMKKRKLLVGHGTDF